MSNEESTRIGVQDLDRNRELEAENTRLRDALGECVLTFTMTLDELAWSYDEAQPEFDLLNKIRALASSEPTRPREAEK